MKFFGPNNSTALYSKLGTTAPGATHPLVSAACRGLPDSLERLKGGYISDYLKVLEQTNVIKKADNSTYQTDSLFYFPVFGSADFNKYPLISPSKVRDANDSLPSNTRDGVYPVLEFLNQPGIDHTQKRIKINNPANKNNAKVELLPLGPTKESILDWDQFFISFYIDEGSCNGTHIRISQGDLPEHNIFSVCPKPQLFIMDEYGNYIPGRRVSYGAGVVETPNQPLTDAEFQNNPIYPSVSLRPFVNKTYMPYDVGNNARRDFVEVKNQGPGLYLITYTYRHVLNVQDAHNGNMLSSSTPPSDRALVQLTEDTINYMKPIVAMYFIPNTGGAVTNAFSKEYPIYIPKGFWEGKNPIKSVYGTSLQDKLDYLGNSNIHDGRTSGLLDSWLNIYGCNVAKRYSNVEEYESFIDLLKSLHGKSTEEIVLALGRNKLLNPLISTSTPDGIAYQKGLKAIAPTHRSTNNSFKHKSTFGKNEIYNFYNGKNNVDLFIETLKTMESLKSSIPEFKTTADLNAAFLLFDIQTRITNAAGKPLPRPQDFKFDLGGAVLNIRTGSIYFNTTKLTYTRLPGGTAFFIPDYDLDYYNDDRAKINFYSALGIEKNLIYPYNGNYKDISHSDFWFPNAAKKKGLLSWDDVLPRNGGGNVVFPWDGRNPETGLRDPNNFRLNLTERPPGVPYFKFIREWTSDTMRAKRHIIWEELAIGKPLPDVSTKVEFFSDGTNVSKNSYKFMGVGTGLRTEQQIERFMRATIDLIYKLT